MTTTPQTLTLAAWLLARLDEDEAQAVNAFPGPWREALATRYPTIVSADRAYKVARVNERASLAHIARHDPARVLAEVEAKRAVLAMLTDLTDDGEWLSREDESDQWLLTKVLRLLALPYAGHPDYREEWQ